MLCPRHGVLSRSARRQRDPRKMDRLDKAGRLRRPRILAAKSRDCLLGGRQCTRPWRCRGVHCCQPGKRRWLSGRGPSGYHVRIQHLHGGLVRTADRRLMAISAAFGRRRMSKFEEYQTPGFTAEASLYRPGQGYRSFVHAGPYRGTRQRVEPQALFGAMSGGVYARWPGGDRIGYPGQTCREACYHVCGGPGNPWCQRSCENNCWES